MDTLRIESILGATKRYCGIVESYEAFDSEILEDINAAFAELHQIGVGPLEGFMVLSDTEEWKDFLPAGPVQNLVRQYVALSVKHEFDPPTNSTTLQSLENRIQQLTCRLSYYVDPKDDNSFFEDQPEEKEATYQDPYWG